MVSDDEIKYKVFSQEQLISVKPNAFVNYLRQFLRIEKIVSLRNCLIFALLEAKSHKNINVPRRNHFR